MVNFLIGLIDIEVYLKTCEQFKPKMNHNQLCNNNSDK